MERRVKWWEASGEDCGVEREEHCGVWSGVGWREGLELSEEWSWGEGECVTER